MFSDNNAENSPPEESNPQSLAVKYTAADMRFGINQRLCKENGRELVGKPGREGEPRPIPAKAREGCKRPIAAPGGLQVV